MLEPPRDVATNRLYRAWLVGRASASKRRRDALKEACANDILFWVNSFVWTYDPDPLQEDQGLEAVIPMVTWPAQERALGTILRCVRERRDLVIEKSRRQGGSWLSLLAMDWRATFKRGQQFLLISRDAFHVDSASPDSLFWKLSFYRKYLPEWLAPRRIKQKMHVEYPGQNSTITGQASTERAGIGGRATAVFVDEFSRIRDDQEILDGTADTSRCRIFNSTHTGPGTAFYRLTERENIVKLRLHWSENPQCNQGLYQYSEEEKRVIPADPHFVYPGDFQFVHDGKIRSPWYDAECSRRGNSRAIAMDLDIDARGSMSQPFDAQMVRNLIAAYACDPYWRGDVATEPGCSVGRLVAGPAGALSLWCHLREGVPPPGEYVIGGDLATGSGATPSCLTVLHCGTGEKVAEFASPFVKPEDCAAAAVALCKLFAEEDKTPARLIWEMQGPGILFGAKVLELGYRRVYYRADEKPLTLKTVTSPRPGWVPTDQVRTYLLQDYQEALHARQFVNRSKAALETCLDFRYDKRGMIEHAQIASAHDPTGARVNHGDRAIADALAWKLAKGRHRQQQQAQAAQAVTGSLAWRRGLAETQRLQEESWG